MFLPFLTYFSFATAVIANRAVLQVFPLFLFVGLRMLLAGIILGVTAHFSKGKPLTWLRIKKDFHLLSVAILSSTVIAPLLRAYSLKYLFAAKAAFLGGLASFYTVIFAYFLLNERLSRKKFLGILISSLGVIVLCFSSSPAEEGLKAFFFFSFPEIAAMFGMGFRRLGITLKQLLLKKDRYSVSEINAITMIPSGIICLIISFLQEDVLACMQNITFDTWMLFIYSVLIGNVLTYNLLGMLLKAHSANFVSIFSFFRPIMVAFLGWALLSEPITLNLIASAIIIFVGVLIFYRDEIRSKKRGQV